MGQNQHWAKSVLEIFSCTVLQSKVREGGGTPTRWRRTVQKVGHRAPKARGVRKMLLFMGENPAISSGLTNFFVKILDDQGADLRTAF